MSNYQDRLASLVQFDLAKADWPEHTSALVIMWAFGVALSPRSGAFLFVSLLGATIFIAFTRVNYAVAVIGVTIWIVGVLGAVGDPVAGTMGLRLLATAIAAALVLAALFIPSRLTPGSPVDFQAPRPPVFPDLHGRARKLQPHAAGFHP